MSQLTRTSQRASVFLFVQRADKAGMLLVPR